MATINQFEVKALKYYPDHEGMSVPYGNLYYKNSKMGEFQADAWAGPMGYTHTSKKVSEEEMMKELKSIQTKNGWDDFFGSFDILLDVLIDFKEDETAFKKLQKKNSIYLKLDVDMTKEPGQIFIHPSGYSISENATEEDISKAVEEIKGDKENVQVTVYRSLDDFNM